MRKLVGMLGLVMTALACAADAPPAPAFTHTRPADWLNSRPLTWADLAGHAVLVEFWTFDCWNCYRSIPWLNALEKRNPSLHVIGVHTPELPQEYVRENVVRKVAELGVKHPVVIDNDYSTWNAYRNSYWPAFYLVDARGRIRHYYYGEMHDGDAQARRIESDLQKLSLEH